MPIPESDIQRMHHRYLEQAGWTAASRQRLLELAGLQPGSYVLEVGSGTGAITTSLARDFDFHTFGLDIDRAATRLACKLDPATRYVVGDGYQLPFAPASFDAAVCHFLLLWLEDPRSVLDEMLRLIRPGGCIMAFAEPDYGGRVDHPAELVELGKLQIDALEKAGADPFFGRRLRAQFVEAGMVDVFSGVLGAEWTSPGLRSALESERQMLMDDLSGQRSIKRFKELLDADRDAGPDRRTLFVPTFFALGFV